MVEQGHVQNLSSSDRLSQESKPLSVARPSYPVCHPARATLPCLVTRVCPGVSSNSSQIAADACDLECFQH